MSSRDAKRLCPDAIFIGVDPDHYTSVSAELIKIFNEFSPRVESVSVDEAFLDVTGCGEVFGSEETLARGLKERVRNSLGLTCSIGIAPTKIMAKLASSVFKPDGLTILNNADVESVLYPLPVEKMWGIGPVAAQALNKAGIQTIGDLARFDLRKLKRMLGQNGEVMGRIARGDEQSPVLSPEDQPDEKSIGHERTFPHDSADPDYLHATLFYLADLVSRRMRRNGFRGRTITIRIRESDFTTITRRTTLRAATDCLAVIYKHSAELFDAHWRSGVKLRLLGISVSHLEKSESIEMQQSLFDSAVAGNRQRGGGVDLVLDEIRDRFGEGSIRAAYSHLRSAD
jgi:DNA polymerase-4